MPDPTSESAPASAPVPDQARSNSSGDATAELQMRKLMAATSHEQVFHHVLQVVLDSEFPGLEAFCKQHGIRKMNRLMDYSHTMLIATAFDDVAIGKEETFLTVGEINAVEALRLWYKLLPGPLRGAKAWLRLSNDVFEDFYSDEFLPQKHAADAAAKNQSEEDARLRLETKIKSVPPAIVTPSKPSPREAFDKRTKVAMDEYSALNKRTEYHDWIDEVRTNFKADRIECLLDPQYKPADADHAELFASIQAHGMRVIKKKVKFLDGANLITECKNDAQNFFAQLHARCATGIYGESTARAIERELQGMPFNADRDQSGHSKFLASWKKKWSNYERARETAAMGPPNRSDGREWLIHSLSQHADTKDIAAMVSTMEKINKTRLSFAEFLELIDTTLEEKDARDRKQREMQPKTQLSANLAAVTSPAGPTAPGPPTIPKDTAKDKEWKHKENRKKKLGERIEKQKAAGWYRTDFKSLNDTDRADWNRR